MKSAVYFGPLDIRCVDVDDPAIIEDHEMLVQVEATSICGSDLHIYGGSLDAIMRRGHSSMGHELVGHVLEVGSSVRHFVPGDRVTTPFSVSCGRCFMCEHGQMGHCETTRGAIIGFGVPLGDLGGTQSERLIIPHADTTALKVPSNIAAAAVLTLSCNLPAAIAGVEAADVQLGDTVAIIGCGPTGLMALDLTLLRGARRIVQLDRLAYRLDVADAKGAVTIDIDRQDWKELAMAETGGRGFDRVIEVVGSSKALQMSIDLVRKGGIISSIGVFAETEFRVEPHDISARNVSLRMNGIASIRSYMDKALSMIVDGALRPEQYFTHRFPLADIDHAYATFHEKSDGVIKVLIQP